MGVRQPIEDFSRKEADLAQKLLQIRIGRFERGQQRELIARTLEVVQRTIDAEIHVAFEVIGQEAQRKHAGH